MRRIVLLFYLVSALLSNSEAALPVANDSLKIQRSGFLVFPFFLISPETSWGFGGAAAYFFKTNDVEEKLRTSDVNLISLYTLEEQIVIVLGSTVYFPKEKQIFRWQSSYSYYPDKFWGIGNNTKASNVEDYTIKQFFLNPQYLWKIKPKLYFGTTVEYQLTKNFKYLSGGIFDQQNITGRYGGTTKGLGLLFTYDSRNATYAPTKGSFIEINITEFTKLIGSSFDFVSYSVEMKKFLAIKKNTIVGLHAFGKFNKGVVPVRNLATLGGSEIMRGFYKGRYADKNSVSFQTEVRQHLYKRLGVVGYASIGRVAGDISKLPFDNFHFAYGAGLRIMVEQKEKLNLRIDYGRGEGKDGLYVILREAF